MKVLSLFDGISCGMLALQRAGLPVECYDAFEIDKYAVTGSKRNFPEIVHHGNVFDGDYAQFLGYDLLLSSGRTVLEMGWKSPRVSPLKRSAALTMKLSRLSSMNSSWTARRLHVSMTL